MPQCSLCLIRSSAATETTERVLTGYWRGLFGVFLELWRLEPREQVLALRQLRGRGARPGQRAKKRSREKLQQNKKDKKKGRIAHRIGESATPSRIGAAPTAAEAYLGSRHRAELGQHLADAQDIAGGHMRDQCVQ